MLGWGGVGWGVFNIVMRRGLNDVDRFQDIDKLM